MRILWFQYEISFAAYCFDWWEKLIVHAVLLSVLFLVSYGAYRQGAALWARLGDLPWYALQTYCGLLVSKHLGQEHQLSACLARAGGRSTERTARHSVASGPAPALPRREGRCQQSTCEKGQRFRM